MSQHKLITCWLLAATACTEPSTSELAIPATATCAACTPETFVIDVPREDTDGTIADATRVTKTLYAADANELLIDDALAEDAELAEALVLVASFSEQGQTCYRRGGEIYRVDSPVVDDDSVSLTVACDCGGAL